MKLRVLVAGCGNMGRSHALAYHQLPEFEVVGLLANTNKRALPLSQELGGAPIYYDMAEALARLKPDVVSINTYPDTHAAYAKMALEAGAHVFLEKPLAETVEDAEQLLQMARQKGKKLVVGYILRVSPAWQEFVALAQQLGKPLVMRMNLNQQSSGKTWETHLGLMQTLSPIVDCGVHYVDIMCQITQAKPLRVSAIGAKLSDQINPGMYNYGQLQVTFSDGSVGWYEAGWGPMISETAYFLKDVIGPKGCVSMVNRQETASDNVDSHTAANMLRLHWAELDASGKYTKADEWIKPATEPDHYELCKLEQVFLLKAIKGEVDLTEHHQSAINSLRIVLAADEAFRTGETITL